MIKKRDLERKLTELVSPIAKKLMSQEERGSYTIPLPEDLNIGEKIEHSFFIDDPQGEINLTFERNEQGLKRVCYFMPIKVPANIGDRYK